MREKQPGTHKRININRIIAYILLISIVITDAFPANAEAFTNTQILNYQNSEKPTDTDELSYSLFSSEKDYTLNCYKGKITGNLYSAGNIKLSGSEITIPGELYAAGSIEAYGWRISLGERNENQVKIEMPDISDKIDAAISDEEAENYISIYNNTISLSGNLISDSDINAGCTYITGSGIIKAENNITINTNGYQSGNGNETNIIYSKSGDITISGNEINLEGLIYAPSGKVSINVNKFNLTGRIYAEEIIFSGSEINITEGDSYNSLIGDKEETSTEEPDTEGPDTEEPDTEEPNTEEPGTEEPVVEEKTGIIKLYDSEDDFAEGKTEDTVYTGGDLCISGSYEAGEKNQSYTVENGNVTVNSELAGELTDEGKFGGSIVFNISDERTGNIGEINISQGHSYMVSGDMLTWKEAEAYCESIGGYLAVIGSQEENSYINSLIRAQNAGNYTAFGYTDEENEGQWRWINGEANVYENWNGGEPNDGLSLYPHQNYGYMYASGRWDDGDGKAKNRYVCEWDEISDIKNSDSHTVLLQVTIYNKEYIDEDKLSTAPYKITYGEDNSAVIEWILDTRKNETVELPVDIERCNSTGDTYIMYNSKLVYTENGELCVTDLSDFILPRENSTESGTWETVYDSGEDGCTWTWLNAKKYLVEDSEIILYAAASDSSEDIYEKELIKIADNSTDGAENGLINLNGMEGRYIRVYAELKASETGFTPVVDSIEIRGNTDTAPEINDTGLQVVINGLTKITEGKETVYRATALTSSPENIKYRWFLDGEEKEISGNTFETAFETAGSHTVKVTAYIQDENTEEIQAEQSFELEVEVYPKETYEGDYTFKGEYPMFNISLDKSAYKPGEMVKVSTDINTEIYSYIVRYDSVNLSVEDITEFTIENVTEGSHTIYVEAENEYGNTLSREISFIVYEEQENIKVSLDKETYYCGDDIELVVDSDYTVISCTSDKTYEEISIDENSILIKKPAEGVHGVSITVKDKEEKEHDVFLYVFVNPKKEEIIIPSEVTETIVVSPDTEIENEEIVEEIPNAGTEEPDTEEPSTEEPSTEEPDTEEPSTEEPSTEEPSTEEPSTEEPSTEKPSTEEPEEEDPYADICPSAELSIDLDGAVITGPTDITGSVGKEGLVNYTLSYSSDGENYTVFAEGTESVTNGVLGSFDPTMLTNGQYKIRLTANGKKFRRMTEVTVTVEGNLKVGNYAVSFQDLNIVTNGISLEVIRSYDSRRRSENGDFGYGWNLSISGGKIYSSGIMGEGWTQDIYRGAYGMAKYVLAETERHEIMVAWENGETEKFSLKLSPSSQNFYPIEFGISASFSAEGNSSSELYVMDADTTELIYIDGVILDESTLEPFNPQKFRLVRADGTEYVFTLADGIREIKDVEGNKITITEDGIEHSDGKSITFVRNENDNITEIKGSDGRTIKYTYDGAGDLVMVTDYAEKTAGFTYDESHNMVEMINETGIVAAILSYDDEGRLISITDAEGNVTEYSHDIEGRTEVITDRRGYSTVYVYDARGNVIKETDPYGNSISYEYDANDNCIKKTDAKGNVTGYTYDAYGNLTEVISPNGDSVKNSYSQSNYITSVTAENLQVMATDYDRYNRIVKLTDGNGNETEYTYDTRGNLTGITDEIGVYETVTYNSDGKPVTISNGEGETVSYTYDEYGRCISSSREISGREYTAYYSYDESGNVIQTVDNMNSVIYYSYDSAGNLISSTDETGVQTLYEYDTLNRLVKILYADGTSEAFTYDAEGNCTEITDRYGLKAEIKYDRLNRTEKITYADGTSESYTYDETGNVKTHTQTTGAVTTYEYDSLGRNTSVTDGLGNVSYYEYDTYSRLTAFTDANGNVTRYEYDANGNLIKTTYPDGGCVTAEYDARDRITSQKDVSGARTTYTYDLCNRLTSVTDAEGSTYSYTYDEAGNLASVSDPENNTVRYEYDACGQLVRTTNAAGMSCSFTYDEAGRLTGYTDYGNIQTEYFYDSVGRLVKTICGSTVTEYTYDEKGRLIQAGDVKYSYDLCGRIKETDCGGKITGYVYNETGLTEEIYTAYGSTDYSYDILGRLTGAEDKDGNRTEYTYDACGNLKEKKIITKEGELFTTVYTYDTCNRLIQQETVGRDGEKTAVYSYTLNEAGLRTAIHEEVNGYVTDKAYEYDILGRLVKERVTGENGEELVNIYTYDKLGNRISKYTEYKEGDSEETEVPEATETYGADENALENGTDSAGAENASENSTDSTGAESNSSEAGGASGYTTATPTDADTSTVTDASEENEYSNSQTGETEQETDDNTTENAETTTDTDVDTDLETEENNLPVLQTSLLDDECELILGTTYYEYNCLNQLISEKRPNDTLTYTYDANGNLISVSGSYESTEYMYNDEGRLVSVTVTKNGEKTVTTYEYDSLGNRTAKTVDSVRTEYVNDITGSLTMVLCEITEGSVTTYTYGHELISMNSAKEGIRYYLSDGHSDVRLLADNKGIITDIYLYDAYGVRLNHTGESENSMQYLGQQYDESTKLYNMRARYMSPDTGRFISMDAYQGSIYDPASLHKYTYTSGNPVMYQDASGYSEGKLENITAGMTINMLLISAAVVYNSNILNQFTNFINYLDNEYKTYSAEIKYYLAKGFAELGFEIIPVINDVKDLIIVFPAIEIANELETVSATEQVRVWEILTVPPVKGPDVLITIPGTAEVPVGIIIDIPISIPQSIGGNILISQDGSGKERIYAPSPKHNVQGGWGSENPIPNNKVGQELLNTAYSSEKNKQLYNLYDGDIIKFQPDGSSGEWHAYKVSNTAREVPTDVYRQMLEDGLISNTDYNKLIKNNWY